MKFLDSFAGRYQAACLTLSVLFITLFSKEVLATAPPTSASTIADNIAASTAQLPGLVTAIAYLLGIIFAVRGVFKLKSHVENPGDGAGQTPVRTPMISFAVGGAFFALPLVYEAAREAFGEGDSGEYAVSAENIGDIALRAAGTDDDFNFLLENITTSLSSLPGLVTAIAYLIGLVVIVKGLLKAKEHIESPEQTKLQESVVRILIGGAMFALPAVFTAMATTISGGSGEIMHSINNLFGVNFFKSGYINDGGVAADCADGGTFGQLMCESISHVNIIPAFLTALSYLFGLVMGVWAILKIRDHALNPQQTSVFEGVTRLIAGGAFFALPVTVDVFQNTIAGDGITDPTITNYNHGTNADITTAITDILGGGACPVQSSGLGLDGVLVCFAADILGPMHIVLNFFAFVAGMIFIMIGISRLVKGVQDGARGPGGIGTIMTFIMGGALISYNDIIRAASSTLTGSVTTNTYAEMQYTSGMTADELSAAHAVITSIIKFMIVVGLISFVRGLFIVRSVAEGNQQASMMAAVTHILGGALAVNLGPLLNAVQSTLGTAAYGISFS